MPFGYIRLYVLENIKRHVHVVFVCRLCCFPTIMVGFARFGRVYPIFVGKVGCVSVVVVVGFCVRYCVYVCSFGFYG